MARCWRGQGDGSGGRRNVLGDDHPDTLSARETLAWLTGLRGKPAEAGELAREVLADRRRVLGEDHPDTLTTRGTLAWTVELQGRYAEAEQLTREVLADRREAARRRPPGHPHLTGHPRPAGRPAGPPRRSRGALPPGDRRPHPRPGFRPSRHRSRPRRIRPARFGLIGSAESGGRYDVDAASMLLKRRERGIHALRPPSLRGRERRPGRLAPPAPQEPSGLFAGSGQRAAGMAERRPDELADPGLDRAARTWSGVASAADR